ncbi:ATPase synthesis protein 25, partial [Clarias magur]
KEEEEQRSCENFVEAAKSMITLSPPDDDEDDVCVGLPQHRINLWHIFHYGSLQSIWFSHTYTRFLQSVAA